MKTLLPYLNVYLHHTRVDPVHSCGTRFVYTFYWRRYLKFLMIESSYNDSVETSGVLRVMESTEGSVKMIPQTVEDPSESPMKIETNGGELRSDGGECKTVDDLSSPGTPGEIGLSKRQLKKIRKKTKWLERKGEKRLRERKKAKEKRAHARANNIDLGPSRKALKKCTMADSSCKVTITVDMSFDSLMIDKDIAKLIKQILRCYTLNRRAKAPVQFSLTGFEGKSKEEMQKHNGYQHWDVKFHPETYLSVYRGKKIVYLTSESDNIIDTLEPDSVYVIGGLVDHNSHKGHCHKLAVEEGIEHARLPLDKFLKMKARKVLTVDHVFEILLRVTEGRTWQEAFMQVLPERKNAQLVLPTESNCSSDSEAQDGTDIGNDNCDAAKIPDGNIDERGETKGDDDVA